MTSKSLELYDPRNQPDPVVPESPKHNRVVTVFVTGAAIVGILICLFVLAKHVVGAPNGSTLSEPGAPLPAISSPSPAPSVIPTPTPSPLPQNRPAGLGKPEWIVVRRGQSVIVPRTEIGEAHRLPDGNYRSPGNGLDWDSDSSTVGAGMKKAAIVIGESRSDGLVSVRSGDTIEVEVPSGAVTFVVDAVSVPSNRVSHTAGTLQIALCACGGGRDRVISAHITT